MSPSIKWLLAFVAIALCAPLDAHAYVDPGTGSFLIQTFLGILMGGILVIKLQWHKLSLLAARMFGRGKEADDPSDE